MPLPPRPAQTAVFSASPPDAVEGASQHWIFRGANFCLVATDAKAGSVLLREDDPDEHFVLLTEQAAAAVSASGRRIESQGDTLFIVPPGASRIEVLRDGYIYRLFTSASTDLLAAAANRAAYADGAPEVAPLEHWPMPVDGYRLRAYPLADHARPDNNMRLFRTRCLMVNAFTRQFKPRDLRKMTPHAHTDFEQGALIVEGPHVHHLRYPWTADLTAWAEDEHLSLGAPSFTLIPPTVIHTTQAVGSAPTRLVEVFAPPRKDFSAVPGRVCNADEYPAPAGVLAVQGTAA